MTAEVEPSPTRAWANASTTALSVDALACGRGDRALFSGLDFRLQPGEAARVLGANGAGKTTLLRTIAGLLRPLDGQIRWKVDNDERDIRESLCFIDHDNALNASLTPLENLTLLTRIAGEPIESTMIDRVLVELGLKRVRYRQCGRLSAGQKRRVTLARLWLTRASLWLLDEPAAALDAESRARLAARIDTHIAAGGLVLYTTHEPLPLASTTTIALPTC